MIAEGTKIERVRVDISAHEVINLLHEDDVKLGHVIPVLMYKFKRSIGLNNDCYVNNGKWCEEIEQHGGSHSWSDTKVHRDVTNAEMNFIDTLGHLEQSLSMLKLSESK